MKNLGFFMPGQSLNEIMNAVSAHLDVMLDAAPAARPQALSELDAFIGLDPLLSALNKDYLDARSAHQSACRDFGSDDGMTSMAAVMMDSAWCAVQTRYMELRADRAMMARAQKAMAAVKAAFALQQRQEQETALLRMAWMMDLCARLQGDNRGAPELWAMYFLLMLQTPPDAMFRARPLYRFNSLAA